MAPLYPRSKYLRQSSAASLRPSSSDARISGKLRRISSTTTRASALPELPFPQISLTGSFGRSDALSSFLENQGIWTYVASLVQPIFTGGALKSNLALAESQQRQAVLSYRQIIQTAFGDVSDALIDYRKYREARFNQEQYVTDLSESVRLATMRHNGGITTYLEVLDAQRALFAQQLTLAQFRAFEFQSLVQLYRALGGGWQ